MNVSRTLLGMATVAFLMFNLCACDPSSYTCNGDEPNNASCSSTADGGMLVGQDASIDTTSGPDNGSDQSATDVTAVDIAIDPCTSCTADQVCQDGACVAKPETCEPWQEMAQNKWTCPGSLDSDIKFALVVKKGKCRATSKIFDMLASELNWDKEKEEFSFFDPQFNATFHCVVIK